MGLVGYEGTGCLIEVQVGMTPRSKKYTLKSKQKKKLEKKAANNLAWNGKVKGKDFWNLLPAAYESLLISPSVKMNT